MACIIQKRKRRVLSSISFSTRSFIPKFQIIFNFSLSLFFTVSFSLRLFRSIFSTPSLLLHVLPFFEDKGHLFPRLHELTIVRFHSPRFPFPYPSSDSSSSSSSTRYLWQPGLFATPRHPWFRAHFRRPKAVPFSPPESTLRPPQITSSHYSALLPLLLFSLSLESSFVSAANSSGRRASFRQRNRAKKIFHWIFSHYRLWNEKWKSGLNACRNLLAQRIGVDKKIWNFSFEWEWKRLCKVLS